MGAVDHHRRAEAEGSLSIAIVTVSDTRTADTDVSGKLIRELAEEFPDDGSFLNSLGGRFMDLMAPFNNFWFHDAAQHGSCSLKKVLPVLTETSYDGMAIGDGGTAMREFQRVVFTDVDAEEKAQVLAHLRNYCKQDTQALVDVLAALRSLV